LLYSALLGSRSQADVIHLEPKKLYKLPNKKFSDVLNAAAEKYCSIKGLIYSTRSTRLLMDPITVGRWWGQRHRQGAKIGPPADFTKAKDSDMAVTSPTIPLASPF
jgi:hypothetical protein